MPLGVVDSFARHGDERSFENAFHPHVGVDEQHGGKFVGEAELASAAARLAEAVRLDAFRRGLHADGRRRTVAAVFQHAGQKIGLEFDSQVEDALQQRGELMAERRAGGGENALVIPPRQELTLEPVDLLQQAVDLPVEIVLAFEADIFDPRRDLHDAALAVARYRPGRRPGGRPALFLRPKWQKEKLGVELEAHGMVAELDDDVALDRMEVRQVENRRRLAVAERIEPEFRVANFYLGRAAEIDAVPVMARHRERVEDALTQVGVADRFEVHALRHFVNDIAYQEADPFARAQKVKHLPLAFQQQRIDAHGRLRPEHRLTRLDLLENALRNDDALGVFQRAPVAQAAKLDRRPQVRKRLALADVESRGIEAVGDDVFLARSPCLGDLSDQRQRSSKMKELRIFLIQRLELIFIEAVERDELDFLRAGKRRVNAFSVHEFAHIRHRLHAFFA